MRLIDVLREAYRAPFATKGNFARYFADEVAMAASMGCITTRESPRAVTFNGHWRLTEYGMKMLQVLDEVQ